VVRASLRRALVPALLAASATLASAPASADPCGYRLHAFCSKVCGTHPAALALCESVEPPPPVQHG
jgi:hypothetical protein